MIDKRERYELRKERVKNKIRRVAFGKPRFSVYRSNKYIYAQIIDDIKGHTLVSASSLDKELKGKIKSGKNIEAAKAVGELIAKRAIEKGIKEVVFDRGGRLYHGRIKAIAETARQAGLKF